MHTKEAEYKQLFLNEGEDILTSLNNTLVEFEKDPTNSALMDEVFRLSHTLKSMAQSMGYERITGLTHTMENALAGIRKGRLTVDAETVSLLFRSIDTLGRLVDEVKCGSKAPADTNPLLEEFERITGQRCLPRDKARSDSDKGAAIGNIRSDAPDHTVCSGPPSPLPSGDVQAVRVPITRLDTILNTAGELATGASRLVEISGRVGNSDLGGAVSRVVRLTRLLQDQMMLIRLIPLEYLFTPYPRMVRDIAVAESKEVDLSLEGGHLGMDRSIQDEINEPLLHLLKNAVIHGIEKPGDREKAGKPRRGRIRLSARRERDFVVMDLSDDGQGMNIDDIRNAVTTAGLAAPEDLLKLTPTEVVMLAARAGYSGSAVVTEMAGRGIGLNASRAKVEALGGTFEIETVAARGSTIHIRLPLTMAFVQAMLASVSAETYCLPLSYVVGTLKVSADRISSAGGREIMNHADTMLPLIRLRERSEPPTRAAQPGSDGGVPDERVQVVVVEAGSRKAGLVVDDLLGRADVVVKPLPGMLAEARGVSGATILSDGHVALILDVGYLLSEGHLRWRL